MLLHTNNIDLLYHLSIYNTYKCRPVKQSGITEIKTAYIFMSFFLRYFHQQGKSINYISYHDR